MLFIIDKISNQIEEIQLFCEGFSKTQSLFYDATFDQAVKSFCELFSKIKDKEHSNKILRNLSNFSTQSLAQNYFLRTSSYKNNIMLFCASVFTQLVSSADAQSQELFKKVANDVKGLCTDKMDTKVTIGDLQPFIVSLYLNLKFNADALAKYQNKIPNLFSGEPFTRKYLCFENLTAFENYFLLNIFDMCSTKLQALFSSKPMEHSSFSVLSCLVALNAEKIDYR